MTESMIERATLAVIEVWQKSNNSPGSVLDCRAVAQAVIMAMREPTDAMCDAAEWGQQSEVNQYQRAIDAALIWPLGSADIAGVPLARD